jgi:hypothetical protein
LKGGDAESRPKWPAGCEAAVVRVVQHSDPRIVPETMTQDRRTGVARGDGLDLATGGCQVVRQHAAPGAKFQG